MTRHLSAAQLSCSPGEGLRLQIRQGIVEGNKRLEKEIARIKTDIVAHDGREGGLSLASLGREEHIAVVSFRTTLDVFHFS